MGVVIDDEDVPAAALLGVQSGRKPNAAIAPEVRTTLPDNAGHIICASRATKNAEKHAYAAEKRGEDVLGQARYFAELDSLAEATVRSVNERYGIPDDAEQSGAGAGGYGGVGDAPAPLEEVPSDIPPPPQLRAAVNIARCTVPYLSDMQDSTGAAVKPFVPSWKVTRVGSEIRSLTAFQASVMATACIEKKEAAATHVRMDGGAFAFDADQKRCLLASIAACLCAGDTYYLVARPSRPLMRMFLDGDILQLGPVTPHRIAMVTWVLQQALARYFAGRPRARAAAAGVTGADLDDARVLGAHDDRRTFLRVYVSTAAYKQVESDGNKLIKTGVHWNWPNVLVTPSMAHQLRASFVAELTNVLGPRVAPANTWDEALDPSVFGTATGGGGGLRMVGADKAEACPDCLGESVQLPRGASGKKGAILAVGCRLCENRGKVGVGRPYRPFMAADGTGARDLPHEAWLLKQTFYEWLVLSDIQTSEQELPTAYGWEVPPDAPLPLEAMLGTAKAAKRAKGKAAAGAGDDVVVPNDAREEHCTLEVMRGEPRWLAVHEFVRGTVSAFFGGVYDRVVLSKLRFNKAGTKYLASVIGPNAHWCHNLPPKQGDPPPPRGVGDRHKRNNIYFMFDAGRGSSGSGVSQRCMDKSGKLGVGEVVACQHYSSQLCPLSIELDGLLFGGLRGKVGAAQVRGGFARTETDAAPAAADAAVPAAADAAAIRRRATTTADDEAAARNPEHWRDLHQRDMVSNALLATIDDVSRALYGVPLSTTLQRADDAVDVRAVLMTVVATGTGAGLARREVTIKINPSSIGLTERAAAAAMGYTIFEKDELAAAKAAQDRLADVKPLKRGLESREQLIAQYKHLMGLMLKNAYQMHPDDVVEKFYKTKKMDDLCVDVGNNAPAHFGCRPVSEARPGPPLPPKKLAALARGGAGAAAGDGESPADGFDMGSALREHMLRGSGRSPAKPAMGDRMSDFGL